MTIRKAARIAAVEMSEDGQAAVAVRLIVDMLIGVTEGMHWFRLPGIAGVLIPYTWGAGLEHVVNRVRPFYPNGRGEKVPSGGVGARDLAKWAAWRVAGQIGADLSGWMYSTIAYRTADVTDQFPAERVALVWTAADGMGPSPIAAHVVSVDMTVDRAEGTVRGSFDDPRTGGRASIETGLPPEVTDEWWRKWSELWQTA